MAGVHESLVEIGSGDQGGGNRDPVRKSFGISRFSPGGSDMPWFVAQENYLNPLPVS